MHRPIHSRAPVLLIAAVLLGLVPSIGCADVPLPTIFAFYPQAMLGWTIFLGSFVGVVLIEAVVLTRLYQFEWQNGIKTAILANLLSTAFGIGFLAHPFELLALIVLFFVVRDLSRRKLQWSAWQSLVLASACSALFVVAVFPWAGFPAIVAQFYFAMLVSFALSVVLESFVIARSVSGARAALRVSVGTNGSSYAVLLFFFALLHFNTGAFAMREWHVHQIIHSEPNRDSMLVHLREYHEWERTRSRMKVQPAGINETSIFELLMARNWADAGDTTHARELMAMIEQNRETEEPEPFLKDARDALQSAEQRQGVKVK